jgi:hypothetical protein
LGVRQSGSHQSEQNNLQQVQQFFMIHGFKTLSP